MVKFLPTTLVIKMIKFGVQIDHKTVIKYTIILKKSIFRYVNYKNINYNIKNYPN
jgi:hypothetical protein